jgi:hypothetical protein
VNISQLKRRREKFDDDDDDDDDDDNNNNKYLEITKKILQKTAILDAAHIFRKVRM